MKVRTKMFVGVAWAGMLAAYGCAENPGSPRPTGDEPVAIKAGWETTGAANQGGIYTPDVVETRTAQSANVASDNAASAISKWPRNGTSIGGVNGPVVAPTR